MTPLWLLACAAPEVRDAEPDPIVILVSLDGFRADYWDLTEHPVLDRLAAEGVHAQGLIPAFPSKTFPNHFTQVTGLYPEHHGVVENTMRDPTTGQWFSITDDAAVRDASWWQGEPIWVTAETQGLISATAFWPGSEAPIQGVLPTWSIEYSGGWSFSDRVDQVLEWLDLPASVRPSFLTLYLEEPDHAGHAHGPGSPEVVASIAGVDAALARLVAGLEERGLIDRVDLVVVSDHGMAALSPERVVFVDELAPLDRLDVINWTPTFAAWPVDESAGELLARLDGLEHARCALKEDLPEALHYADHERIPPVICLADEGWSISSRDWFRDNEERFVGGTHGWDPSYPSMHGLFVGRGPHFREGVEVVAFESVQLYELMTGILGLEAAPNDGDAGALRSFSR